MSSNVPTLSKGVTRLENAIVTLSGPALATSGIIAGVDVLTNNLIARYAPGAGAIAGLVWAICLMLTLDFQVLMLGVRARRIYASSKKGGWQKTGELALCVAIAAALGYVSLQMGSIFARMLGTNLTIVRAQADLGINPIALIYERSALVLLLIFLSGWLREHDAATIEASTPPPGQSSISDETMQRILARLTKVDELEQTLARVSVTEALQENGEGLRLLECGVNPPQENNGKIESKCDVVAAALAQKPDATPSEIAQMAGCSERTAAKWLEKLRG